MHIKEYLKSPCKGFDEDPVGKENHLWSHLVKMWPENGRMFMSELLWFILKGIYDYYHHKNRRCKINAL